MIKTLIITAIILLTVIAGTIFINSFDKEMETSKLAMPKSRIQSVLNDIDTLQNR